MLHRVAPLPPKQIEERPEGRSLQVLQLAAPEHHEQVPHALCLPVVTVVDLVLQSLSRAVHQAKDICIFDLRQVSQEVLYGKCLSILQDSISVQTAHV